MKYIVNLILILTLFTNTASATILLPSYNLLQTLNDFSTEESKGFQFSTGFGVSTNAGESAVSPKGSTTIGLTSKGQEKEQITKATIGNGNITTNIQSYTRDENGNIIGTVGGTTLDNNNQLLAGLNRDVNNSQEITKDMITCALDGSMTVDNRILSLLVGDTSGVKSIAKDFKNFGKNLGQIYKNITKNNIIVDAIKTALNKDNDLNIIDAVKQYIDLDKRTNEILNNKKLTKEINGATNLDPKQLQQSLSEIADVYNENGDKLNNLQIANIDSNNGLAGLSYVDKDGNTQTITINLANVDITNPNEIAKVIAHETTKIQSHHSNEYNAIARGNTASNLMDMLNYGNENTNSMTKDEWLVKHSDSSIIREGNLNAISNSYNAMIGNGDIDTYIVGKLLGEETEKKWDKNIQKFRTDLLDGLADQFVASDSVIEKTALFVDLVLAQILVPENTTQIEIDVATAILTAGLSKAYGKQISSAINKADNAITNKIDDIVRGAYNKALGKSSSKVVKTSASSIVRNNVDDVARKVVSSKGDDVMRNIDDIEIKYGNEKK